MTQEEKDTIKQQRLKKRDNYEKKNQGDFELIFPSVEETLEEYQKYLTYAKMHWEDFNAGSSYKSKKLSDSVA